MQKDLQYYLSLPYTFVFRADKEDQIIVAKIEELTGCSAHGATIEEAAANLRDNLRDWLAFSLEKGIYVPEPEAANELPSGKWLQRVPRSLHLKVSRLAAKEEVSLNQLVTSLLAEAVGQKLAAQAARHSEQLHPESNLMWMTTASMNISPRQYEIYNINEAKRPILVKPLAKSRRIIQEVAMLKELSKSTNTSVRFESRSRSEKGTIEQEGLSHAYEA